VADETVDTRAVERDPDAVVGTSAGTGEEHRRGTVFWSGVGISAVFVALGVLIREPFNTALADVVGWIKTNLGWLYLLSATFFLGFVLYIAFSRYGKLTLGKPGDKPEFGLFAWFAMLFQAGMGIGILFWGSASPSCTSTARPSGRPARARRRRRTSPSSTRSSTGACIPGPCTPPSASPWATSATGEG
jgi:choline-glycine betaine transporter